MLSSTVFPKVMPPLVVVSVGLAPNVTGLLNVIAPLAVVRLAESVVGPVKA